MSVLQLLTNVRNILYQRTNQHYPILDAVTLFEGMNEVHYKESDGKLYITLVLDLPPINEVSTGVK